MAGQQPRYAFGALRQTWLTGAMDTHKFRTLIDDARNQVDEPGHTEAVAEQAAKLLATCRADQIVAAQQVFCDPMAGSCRNGAWSDDGFEHQRLAQIRGAAADPHSGVRFLQGPRCDGGDFRGWLTSQEREIFKQVVADPDSSADLPAVHASAAEAALSFITRAHRTATGGELPANTFTARYPGPDFDDSPELKRRLPKPARLDENRGSVNRQSPPPLVRRHPL